MDVWVKTQDNEEIIVEMQMENSDNFIKRSEYIASKLYSSQNLKGKYYNELNNVAIVGILNFTMFKEYREKFNFCFRYTEKDEKFELSDHVELRFVELTKLAKLLEKPVEQLTKKEMWALFFRYAADSSKKDLIKTIIQKEEGIQMASKVLTEISKDETERVAYIEHLIWTTDQESKILFAEKKAKLKEKNENAKNFLKAGVDINIIAPCTGLSMEEVEKLRDEINK